MIATVKIAPVERWCEQYATFLPEHPEMAEIAGLEVEIDTDSCREHSEEMWHGRGIHKARKWQLTYESACKMQKVLGGGPGPGPGGILLCEHMLEMD